MKAIKFSVAAAAALAFSTAAMADAPTVYGVMNVEAGSFDSGATVGGQKMGAKTQSSRFGIKGTQDLEDTNLKAVYQVEFGFDAVGGVSIAESSVPRNTFLGVTGDFGTVLAGNHDHPSKLALYRSGAGVFAADTTAKLVQTELRSSPAVAYVSNFSEDITVAAAVVFDGNTTGAQTNNSKVDLSGKDKEELMHFDVAAWGKAGDLKYGVGVIVVDDAGLKKALGFGVDPIMQASVGYDVDALSAGFSIQKGGSVTSKKANDNIYLLAHATAKLDGGYYAGVGVQMAQKGNSNEKDSTDIGLIAGKKFGKSANLYVAAKSFDKNSNGGVAMTNPKHVDGDKAGMDLAVGMTVAF